jgi:NADH dehydrogenase FAD-containing subunit
MALGCALLRIFWVACRDEEGKKDEWQTTCSIRGGKHLPCLAEAAQRRRSVVAVDMAPGSIAVLGGGLTGLSAAFHLARRFPTTPIALINRDARCGGWVRSQRVTHHGADVLLEAGPRTLRPTAPSVLELVCCPRLPRQHC